MLPRIWEIQKIKIDLIIKVCKNRIHFEMAIESFSLSKKKLNIKKWATVKSKQRNTWTREESVSRTPTGRSIRSSRCSSKRCLSQAGGKERRRREERKQGTQWRPSAPWKARRSERPKKIKRTGVLGAYSFLKSNGSINKKTDRLLRRACLLASEEYRMEI